MKRQCQISARRQGAVLLMILGLMAMFAITILTYMVVTSNMAETAQNSAKIDSVVEIPAQDDLNAALKNLVVGSNNESNPIGPFGILENMYGDWEEYDEQTRSQKSDASFLAFLQIFPDRGFAIVTPTDELGNYWGLSESMNLFEEAGGVLTFKGAWELPQGISGIDGIWNNDLEETSTFVLEKVITDPLSRHYEGKTHFDDSNGTFTNDGDFWRDHYALTDGSGNVTEPFNNKSNFQPCDYWHFKVELTDDLKRFLKDCNFPNGVNQDFNEQKPKVFVRLNRPAYSGTGAGGFTPGETHDAAIPADGPFQGLTGVDQLRIPFAFWTNAAAPDMRPFKLLSGSKPSFRSFWAHLTDVNYDSNVLWGENPRYAMDNGDSFVTINPPVTYGYLLADDGTPDSYLEPVRMDPAYTAPDSRTAFLAHYDGIVTASDVSQGDAVITPSFHRPSLFKTLTSVAPGGTDTFFSYYTGLYSSLSNVSVDQWMVALLRKLTPRPLPNDHWNFNNGFLNVKGNVLTPWETANYLANDVNSSNLSGVTFDGHWDVDNDGDGVREGVWIPSGLPIRVDKNGVPYATMFSYTVLDLDGRANVNTAGNWDQIPNIPTINGSKIGSQIRLDANGQLYGDNGANNGEPGDNWQPYNYVSDLNGIWTNIKNSVGLSNVGLPYVNAEDLNSRRLGTSYGFLDERGNSVDNYGSEIGVAVRGDGRGTSSVLLYEALSSIFSESYSTYDVATVAQNMLWRRGLTLSDNPQGRVDESRLEWNLYDQMGSQPGSIDANGDEKDDLLGSREAFFRYMDPFALVPTADERASGKFDDPENDPALKDAKMVYPYRGKTTVNAIMDKSYSYAVYDFANTAFRSYDPLGAQVYTYAPRYSRNPYFAYQYVMTLGDSAYSLPMFERLLRPWDSDASDKPSQLVDDLGLGMDVDEANANIEQLNGKFVTEKDRATARQSLTTISSDVPSPSLVFPENNELVEGQYRVGHFGFPDLIRRCVRNELYKAFKRARVYSDTNPLTGDKVAKPGFDFAAGNYYVQVGANQTVFDSKVEEITNYLVSMLPPEIMAGEKIDLNALSQKNYWLDVVEEDDGTISPLDHYKDRNLHNYGLAKRMEFARGLYLVVMTLLYEDMNAKSLYEDIDPNDSDPIVYSDYIEGSFNLEKFKNEDDLKDEDKGDLPELLAEELMATRVAQWCANVVDFADPDATMTPFFFDPTPFDGWWVYDNDWLADNAFKEVNGYNRWEIGKEVATPDGNTFTNPGWGGSEPEIHFLFSSSDGLPKEQMFEFFRELLDKSEDALATNDPNLGDNDDISGKYCNIFGNREWMKDPSDEGAGASATPTSKRLNAYVAEWMTKEIKDLNDQSSDLGFRLVWGMERPDLVLTETLNFHDLGIADTKLEQDTDENVGNVAEGPDDTYDQVKRPVGSTYLELYCTANPNVPQSRELYDYDNGVWKLRLSKTTPVYTDSLGRELEMPVWRVAISDSSVPAKWNGVKEDVYRKKTNNVLEWFKDDDYSRWFFTMQPPQFRNYPTDYPKVPDNSSAVLIDSIAQLDAYELDASGSEEENNSHKDVKEKAASEVLDRVLKDWEKFDFPTSNVLGPAVASKKAFDRSKSSNRDNSWRKREIALDRVVWFTKALGDAGNDNDTKLGTAGEYPDALRTFCKTTNDVQYLEPNQYLIVGPDEKRSVGSTYYDPNNDSARFGVDANSATNVLQLSDIGANLLSKPAFSGNYTFMVAKSNIGGVGLNISEPLWTASKKDPYVIPYAENQKFYGKTRIIDPSLDPKGDASAPDGLETARCSVMDVPFELRKDMDEDKRADVPDDDYDNVVGNYPIVKDGLFGIGTVPAYKSSFVQRVADPNRPYHPLMNPYITVDWNVMDLTVFTGERVGMGDEYESLHRIAEKGYSNSEIKLKKNDFLKVDDDDTFKLEDVFSSRQWGNSSQKSFNKPSSERPNPWARAFEFDDNDNTGLQRPRDRQDPSVVLKFAPSHTLGMFNNMGDRGNWVADPNDPNNTIFDKNSDGATFKGLNEKFLTSGDVYKGAPRKPFEHLVWNDAPYSNPMELALVPASSSSRFGLEFVRNDKVGDDIGKLYEYEADKFKNKSLGSHGLFGFEDWQGKDDKKRGGVPGSYLNFFVSSRKAGETLNLCKALEFVSVPSLYLGTKRLITDTNDQYIEDENGNPLFFSRRREPGKVNINTVNESVWKAISPNSDRILAENRLPSVEWSDFQDSRNAGDFFCYFQPSHTLGLWVQLNKSSAPCPSFSSIMAQNQCDLDSASSGDFEALLDNTVPRRDDDGEILYTYTFLEDPNDPDSETHSGVGTLEEVDAHQPGVLSCEKLTEKRGNLYEATAEMQRLSGLTTTRSNAFAVWVTVGYFEVERCNPGVNMPNVDPDGNTLTFDMLIDPSYKWYHYYQAIYPDGYTYGKELGSEFGETRRHRGFSIIDRSIPVDFRRGNSGNYENAILLKRVID